jgi:predicted nucleotidyltransferase
MLHATISRRGGKARSEAKTVANRAKMAAYWGRVRSGEIPAPTRHKKPPSLEKIAEILKPYCREKGITCLQVFGSVARGQARQGSDVDLIATFDPSRKPRGLDFFAIPDEMEALLGVPVQLMTDEAVADITNPFLKNAIVKDSREILAL